VPCERFKCDWSGGAQVLLCYEDSREPKFLESEKVNDAISELKCVVETLEDEMLQELAVPVERMFCECRVLGEVPVIPAIGISKNAYYNMFKSCTTSKDIYDYYESPLH
jgi:hypothetical protein